MRQVTLTIQDNCDDCGFLYCNGGGCSCIIFPQRSIEESKEECDKKSMPV